MSQIDVSRNCWERGHLHLQGKKKAKDKALEIIYISEVGQTVKETQKQQLRKTRGKKEWR